ncbi:hypothetical protein BCR44DRAFT_1434264, partial [Catenaria anguillulae PL171]
MTPRFIHSQATQQRQLPTALACLMNILIVGWIARSCRQLYMISENAGRGDNEPRKWFRNPSPAPGDANHARS